MKKLVYVNLMILFLSYTVLAEIKDHPVITPMKNSTLIQESSKQKNFGTEKFDVNENDSMIRKEISGKFWYLKYEIKLPGTNTTDTSISEDFILENYRKAALAKNGIIQVKNTYDMTFCINKDNGGKIWVNVYAWGSGEYGLTIVEPEVAATDLIFGADEIKQALDEKGFLILNGILFDSSKSTLQEKSIKALSEVVKLLRKYPSLKVEIQGHTDSIGGDDANMKLSENRAQTVKEFLLLFGIADDNMTAKGYGETKPVASNDSDEGRKQNRRVELHKLQ